MVQLIILFGLLVILVPAILLGKSSLRIWERHRQLQLRHTIGGAGVAAFRWGRTVGLLVTGPKFTTEELDKVIQLRYLEELQIDHTAIHSDDLSKLSRLRYLRVLWLYDSSMGGDAISALKSVKSLRFLSFALARMTKRGLGELTALDHLEGLKVHGEKSWSDAVKALEDALPNCRVHFEPWDRSRY